MTDPANRDDLEGDLHSVTDEEWLTGHRALIDTGAVPPDEAAYLYDPQRDPATVTAADLTPDRDPAEPEETDHG